MMVQHVSKCTKLFYGLWLEERQWRTMHKHIGLFNIYLFFVWSMLMHNVHELLNSVFIDYLLSIITLSTNCGETIDMRQTNLEICHTDWFSKICVKSCPLRLNNLYVAE